MKTSKGWIVSYLILLPHISGLVHDVTDSWAQLEMAALTVLFSRFLTSMFNKHELLYVSFHFILFFLLLSCFLFFLSPLLSFFSLFLFVSVCLSVCLSVSVSLWHSLCLCLSVCLALSLSLYLCLSVCLSVSLSLSLSLV